MENLYELVKNNRDKENELKMERKNENNEVTKILQKRTYSSYKFLMREFICFIKDIISKYSNLDNKLENIRLSEVKITYSCYPEEVTRKKVEDFLANNNLGEIKYDIIIWNQDKTVKDFIDAYYAELHKCEQYIVITKDLKAQYIHLLEETKEYEPLLNDRFKKFINRYTRGIDENISYKVYYYIQTKLEERNYDIDEYETRDFHDLSYYDDTASWDKYNPDMRLRLFLKACNISSCTSSIINNDSTLDLENATKSELEALIRDIKAIKVNSETKSDEPILSRGKAYKEVHKHLQ